MKTILYYILYWSVMLGVVGVPVGSITAYNYTQRYVMNADKSTATKGLLFQKTIYLGNYTLLGQGNGLFGDYKRYSRSAIMAEGQVLSVYEH